MKRILIAALAAFASFTTLQAQDVLTGSSASDSRIGPRDVLDVRVVQDEKLNTPHATVGEDGAITMPQIGKVAVSGLTQHEAEAQIRRVLEAKVLNRADVSVQIVEFGNKPISVLGSVTRPGSIGGSNLTLIQALTAAGGLASGHGPTLYVIRTGMNGLVEQIPISVDELLVVGNPDLNLPLSPNDVINVPAEVPVTVYVMGEVTHPGKVELKRAQSPSALQAIAAAGGPTDRAGKEAVITHAGGGTTTTINFRRAARGQGKDAPLQDGDTIFIPESYF
jgi:polysaccharide export outer membrane protein